MKKSVLALIAMSLLLGFAGMAEAQRGGGGGGGHGGMSGGHAGGGGWSGGGGGGWHGGGTGGSWHGGGGGWHGGNGWHGGGWHGGWHGGCWGCGSGWWWGGVGLGVAIAAPWWGYPYWGGYYGWGAPYYDSAYYGTGYTGYYGSDPVYMQQQPAAPAYAPAPSAPPVTWFYCTDPAGYYPYVQSCSRPWMRVVPDATQPSPAPSYQPQQG